MLIRARSLVFILLALTACSSFAPRGTPNVEERRIIAAEIAREAKLTLNWYSVGGFQLQGFRRYRKSEEPLVVYIEGDGHAWERNGPSDNPTPINPLALRLAAADSSSNVLYLARPCQYTRKFCEVKYWTSHRMAREVVAAYRQLIENEMREGKFSSIRLVGFSGGGSIAALLANQLHRCCSIVDLRTVAGNLDHRLWTKQLALIPMEGSLNAADIAASINHIPQLHFVGRDDRVIFPEIYASYRQHSVNTRCVSSSLQSASHVRGWAELWSTLSKTPVSCAR
ncbi:MAG: alpha/beta fold hydrolase [Cellvibrionaceae bacterium]